MPINRDNKQYAFDEKGNQIKADPSGTTGYTIDPEGIDHPAHYNNHPSGVECIDIAEHHSGNIFQVFKYIWRAGLKVGDDQMPLEAEIEDLKKAKWYLAREISRLTRSIEG